MLDLFGWNVGMTPIAAILLVLGALIFGAIAQVIGRVVVGYEWIFTAVAALAGGWIGSEALGPLSTWGPEFEGLFILPAVIGGVILGGVVDVIVRRSTGGAYFAPRPI